MKSILLVGAGGALGSIARYLAGLIITRPDPLSFPWGTFAINITGCFLIGLIMALVWNTQPDKGFQLFIITGFLGGFTTFSAFGLETFGLLVNKQLITAALYAVTSLLAGLCAVWGGQHLYKTIFL